MITDTLTADQQQALAVYLAACPEAQVPQFWAAVTGPHPALAGHQPGDELWMRGRFGTDGCEFYRIEDAARPDVGHGFVMVHPKTRQMVATYSSVVHSGFVCCADDRPLLHWVWEQDAIAAATATV